MPEWGAVWRIVGMEALGDRTHTQGRPHTHGDDAHGDDTHGDGTDGGTRHMGAAHTCTHMSSAEDLG